VADALADRIEPDPAVTEEVDRVAWRVDDIGRFPAIFQVVAFILVLVGLGLDDGVLHGRWIALVPVCGLAAVGVVAGVVLRRRRQRVARWLEHRPRPADWRSTPPVPPWRQRGAP
jgi:hypothetical protein